MNVCMCVCVYVCVYVGQKVTRTSLLLANSGTSKKKQRNQLQAICRKLKKSEAVISHLKKHLAAKEKILKSNNEKQE